MFFLLKYLFKGHDRQQKTPLLQIYMIAKIKEVTETLLDPPIDSKVEVLGGDENSKVCISNLAAGLHSSFQDLPP